MANGLRVWIDKAAPVLLVAIAVGLFGVYVAVQLHAQSLVELHEKAQQIDAHLASTDERVNDLSEMAGRVDERLKNIGERLDQIERNTRR